MKVTIVGLADKCFVKEGNTIRYYRAYGYFDTTKTDGVYVGSEFSEFKIDKHTYDSMVDMYHRRGIFTCELEFNMHGQVINWECLDD